MVKKNSAFSSSFDARKQTKWFQKKKTWQAWQAVAFWDRDWSSEKCDKFKDYNELISRWFHECNDGHNDFEICLCPDFV